MVPRNSTTHSSVGVSLWLNSAQKPPRGIPRLMNPRPVVSRGCLVPPKICRVPVGAASHPKYAVVSLWVVNIMDMREALYPWTGLLIKSVLVGTHVVVCLDIEEQLYSFRARRRLRPRSCLSGKPLVFLLRYAFQVLQIRSQCEKAITGLSTSYKAVS